MTATVSQPGDPIRVRRGQPTRMERFHSHDDIEVNIVINGMLEYQFGGEPVVVPEGHTGLFWAATPHRMVSEPSRGDDMAWVTLSLPTVLQWSLPSPFTRVVLAQGIVVVPNRTIGDHLMPQFSTWQQDLADAAMVDALSRELEALLIRILRAHEDLDTGTSWQPPDQLGSAPHSSRVAEMARHIAEHFREPIGPKEIAEAVGLSPGHATTLFRESVGLTLGDQLTRHRIAEAQRLLVTTEMTTTSIAAASGFGSSSGFYDHFVRACGVAPGAYRASRIRT